MSINVSLREWLLVIVTAATTYCHTTATADGQQAPPFLPRRSPSGIQAPLLIKQSIQIAVEQARLPVRSCTGEASDVRRALLKSAAVVLQGGATSPRRPGKGTEGQPGRWREGGGDDAIDDDETEDLDALLRSVTVDGDALDAISPDLQDLSSLGDFSGLGRLDFSREFDDDVGGFDEDSFYGRETNAANNPTDFSPDCAVEAHETDGGSDSDSHGLDRVATGTGGSGEGTSNTSDDSRVAMGGNAEQGLVHKLERFQQREEDGRPDGSGEDSSKYDSSQYERSEYESSEEEDNDILEDSETFALEAKDGERVAHGVWIPDGAMGTDEGRVADGEMIRGGDGVRATDVIVGSGEDYSNDGEENVGDRDSEGDHQEEEGGEETGKSVEDDTISEAPVDNSGKSDGIVTQRDGERVDGADRESDAEETAGGCVKSGRTVRIGGGGDDQAGRVVGLSAVRGASSGSGSGEDEEDGAKRDRDSYDDGDDGDTDDQDEGNTDDEDDDNDHGDGEARDEGPGKDGMDETRVEQVRGGGSDEWATEGESVDEDDSPGNNRIKDEAEDFSFSDGLDRRPENPGETPTDGRSSDWSDSEENGSLSGSQGRIQSEIEEGTEEALRRSRSVRETRVFSRGSRSPPSQVETTSDEPSDDVSEEISAEILGGVDSGDGDNDAAGEKFSLGEDGVESTDHNQEVLSRRASPTSREAAGQAKVSLAVPKRRKQNTTEYKSSSSKKSITSSSRTVEGEVVKGGSEKPFRRPLKKEKTVSSAKAEDSEDISEPSRGKDGCDESDEALHSVGMEEWLENQTREPVRISAPPRKTLAQLLKEGYPESEEDEEELAQRLQGHRQLGRRWVSGITDAAGFQRARKQATANMITKGASPGTSPGRERLALVGVGLAAGTAGFHKLLRRRIEDADFGEAADVEMETLSPLAFVLRKKASIRRVSPREHDLACLHSMARWGIVLFAVGVVLSVALRAGEPLFICTALALSRYFTEPIFFVHAMGRGGGVADARRPFPPPSFLNALIGSPHGVTAIPPGGERVEIGR